MAFEVSHGMDLDSLRDTIQGSIGGKFEWVCHFCKHLSVLAPEEGWLNKCLDFPFLWQVSNRKDQTR